MSKTKASSLSAGLIAKKGQAVPAATSVVPPPMSTTIEPRASVTGMPAPIAAAIGSSIR